MSYCERAVHNRILKNIETKEDGVQLVERTGWSGAGQRMTSVALAGLFNTSHELSLLLTA